MNNFMKQKRITLTIDDNSTTMNNVQIDISQDFSVSFVLYLFYNADLLKTIEQISCRATGLNFVDDVNILTYGINTNNNCRTLKKLHVVCEQWNRRHETFFAPIKYDLIHLTKNQKKFDMTTTFRIKNVMKSSFNFVKMLKMQINNKLK